MPMHNCVHATSEGASIAGIHELFHKPGISFAESDERYILGPLSLPSKIHSSIEKTVIKFLTQESLKQKRTPEAQEKIQKEILWMEVAGDDPYFPKLFRSKGVSPLESQYVPMTLHRH